MYVYFKLETEREKNICVYVYTLDIKKNFYNNSKYLFSKSIIKILHNKVFCQVSIRN